MRPRLPALLVAAVVATASAWPSQAATDDNAAQVRHDYLLNCAACHLLEGQGSRAVPSLADTGRLFALPSGREYLGRVPGAAHSPLDDQRLAAVLNWILSRFGHTTADPPYTASEIGRLRAHPYLDPLAARRLLLAGKTVGRE